MIPFRYLSELPRGQASFPLPKPLRIEVSEGQRVTVFAPALCVGGIGDTVDLAVEDLAATVWSLWEELHCGRLDPSAIATRWRLAEYLYPSETRTSWRFDINKDGGA